MSAKRQWASGLEHEIVDELLTVGDHDAVAIGRHPEYSVARVAAKLRSDAAAAADASSAEDAGAGDDDNGDEASLASCSDGDLPSASDAERERAQRATGTANVDSDDGDAAMD